MVMPKYKIGYATIALSPGKPDTPPPAPVTEYIATQEEIEEMLSKYKYKLKGPEKKPVIHGNRRYN